MSHTHNLYDSDMRFLIDPSTRSIKNQSKKTIIVRGDHNSERFTFEMPRMIEGHDMSTCDIVQIHYLNIDSSNTKYEGLYIVDDIQISSENDQNVVFSWLISRNASRSVGALNFIVRFMCTAADGTVDYAWSTTIHKEITVSETINNTETVVEKYADVIAEWESRIMALEQNGGGSGGNVNVDLSAYVTRDEISDDTIDVIVERTAGTENNYSPLTDTVYWKDNTTIDTIDGSFKASTYPVCVTPEIYVLSDKYYKIEGGCFEPFVYQYGFDGGLVEYTTSINDGVFKVCYDTATIRLVVPKVNYSGEDLDLNGTIEHFNSNFKLYICDKYKLKDSVELPDNIEIPNVPTKVSELENDSGFITKADIPTDESYELIGETPLTLAEKLNIKLESAVETTYEAKTPTVWNFDDMFASGDYTVKNCTVKKENDHYKITSGATVTQHYNSYVLLYIPVEAGKTYTLCWDNSASKKEPNAGATDWGGSLTLYDGDSTSNIIKSGVFIDTQTSYVVTPTTNIFQIRYYPASSHVSSSKANIVGRFNAMWLNEGDTIALTEIYSINGTFNGSVTLQKVPKGATVTTIPTARVYAKVPTDKTLTKRDVPADGQATGERIEAVKNLLPLYGKTIVNFGDSIFGNAQPPVDISTHLANKTGATVYNCGFGGCRMTPHSTAEYAAFSMCNLATAISSGDFTLQENAVASTTVTLNNSIKANFARLKTIDFSNVDIVTIAYGSNDFNGYGAMLDNEENLFDITTYGGALRYSIETLLNKYPNLKIFILSIAWRFWTNENNEYVDDTNTHTNNGGKLTKEYNAKLKEIADEYNLPFVDNYNIGIGKFNRSQYFNANDGAHHKETGRKVIASHIAKELY